ncbi:hypothetical protein HDU92_008312 [Lobulomyces angularis]|nr:hypothetical protein HDU92_008312 [Lobulomyces angularis]
MRCIFYQIGCCFFIMSSVQTANSNCMVNNFSLDLDDGGTGKVVSSSESGVGDSSKALENLLKNNFLSKNNLKLNNCNASSDLTIGEKFSEKEILLLKDLLKKLG